MIVFRRFLTLWLFNVIIMWGCSTGTDHLPPLFKLLPSNHTGIKFSNVISQTDSLNILEYMYFYNGGGVGILDVNNDGLPDIFFSGNMVSSRLYLNKGDFRFEDITEKAGVLTNGWCSGVAIADVNNDNYADIYVSRAGSKNPRDRGNLLFINNGNNTFTESAASYGIADSGYNTQAAFFDYDKDGDLDLYVLSHDHSPKKVNDVEPIKKKGEARNTDKLYRNDGHQPGEQPVFTDVSREAGIQIEGYGLGVAISDINSDGWPDIYVANDFLSSDLLYINNQNGTFTNRIGEYLKHQSYNSMGVDIADYNNDGLPDIVVADMLPEDNFRQKMMSGSMTNEKFQLIVNNGYEPQYMRNTLQLNNGNGHFSEIGQLAGIDKTDWSWSTLFADFDNDGFKDLFVTNGYLKDITDKDFIIFGNNKTVLQDARSADSILLELIDKQKGVEVSNYFFRNNGDLTFTHAKDWAGERPGFSNGAAYADLDNDGDLDMVVNNINEEALVYRNESEKSADNNYLQVSLVGDSSNRHGLGTKIELYCVGNTQFYEHTVYRGFQSSVTSLVHFGLDTLRTVDSLKIYWPDGRTETLLNIAANQRINVYQKNGEFRPAVKKVNPSPFFSEVSASLGVDFLHKENSFSDLTTELLMPHNYSRMGPAMAVGDIDGNGLEDFIVGGSSGNAACMYLQDRAGQFIKRDFPEGIDHEDMGMLLFDADNDNDLDLYLVSGGTEFAPESPLYRDRFYRNDGMGNYALDVTAIPATRGSGSCVTAADYDGDGDLDLFVGRRFSPGKYPQSPGSYIFENNGGRFTDVTDKICAPLKQIGMVTSAIWTDFDNDQQIDLLVVGEWMPLTFFRNHNGKFIDISSTTGTDVSAGWWNSIVGGDFDSDGDTDYLIGNLGLNTPFRAAPGEPLSLVTADMDGSGTPRTMLVWSNKGEEYPWVSRDVMLRQIPRLGKNFFNHADYAKARISDIVSPNASQYSVLRSVWLSSSYLENLGNGKFSLRPLPLKAQFAPVHGVVVSDVDFDGNLDCLVAGNFYSPDVSIGRYDASIGLLLKGDGKGNFTEIPAVNSGFFTDKDVRSLVKMYSGSDELLLVAASNADSLRIFSQKVRPEINLINLKPMDVYALAVLADGKKRKCEFYYGSGYLSQSTRTIDIPATASTVLIVDSKGNTRSFPTDSPGYKRVNTRQH